ncbi:AB hydrolase superfamily protein [Colletotrichum siamense]|uniref:AB hydrolase superfamily protein n=1 Tax=Colletotrichum siamense TaxID=690259 RepID=UPI001872280E|nr:AB hydrolase superfamily protein [Colletotrichum siamense]KAF5497173.1 AB hydrolase superfamily protein [Colletotrichum siamense]
MLTEKTKPEYVDLDAEFHPLPKHGHLSAKHPVYAASEAAIGAMYAQIQAQPDFASVRRVAGDADAPMPRGGPDRYRDVTTELLYFKARDGEEIELKVYKSPIVRPNAVLMYRMHGGGWCVGRHEVDGAENVYAATNKNIVVVSVCYRKAPEDPFPCGLHDSYDGLLWCKMNATALGVDPEKIILSGSSAGGNLASLAKQPTPAAALAIECRDNGITGVIAQVLHFPIICHPKFFPREKYEYGSYIQNNDNPVIGALAMEGALDAYLPKPKPDHRHSPILAKSLKDLPRTLIQCAGYDVLRDEALAYAEALEAEGVDVEVHAYRGLPHCFPAVLPAAEEEVSRFYERYMAFLDKVTGGST